MDKNKIFGRTYKELAIIGAIITIFINYTPTAYRGAKEVFGWGIKYNEINAAISTHADLISKNSIRIDGVERDVRSWRAIWCIAELSNKANKSIPQAVQNACQDWIRNP